MSKCDKCGGEVFMAYINGELKRCEKRRWGYKTHDCSFKIEEEKNEDGY